MDKVIDVNLLTIVQREVEDYAKGDAWQAVTYAVSDLTRQIFLVVGVSEPPRKWNAEIVIMARIVDDKLVIVEDLTDRPLVDELVRAGIPREQIVLADAGEEFKTE